MVTVFQYTHPNSFFAALSGDYWIVVVPVTDVYKQDMVWKVQVTLRKHTCCHSTCVVPERVC